MGANDAASSVERAEADLREEWRESGPTSAVSCPSCDAEEYAWEVEDELVRVRCESCGYADSRRHE